MGFPIGLVVDKNSNWYQKHLRDKFEPEPSLVYVPGGNSVVNGYDDNQYYARHVKKYC